MWQALLTFALACIAVACGKVVPSDLGLYDDSDAAPAPAIIQQKPSCPILVGYIHHWQIARIKDSEALQGFAVVVNQGDDPIDLTQLALGYRGDTHATVEIDAFTEPSVGRGLILNPGQRAGFLTPSARNVIDGILPSPTVARDENLFQLHIQQWLTAVESDHAVSAEMAFVTPAIRLALPLRFTPGDETRPLAAAYACAVERR